MNKENNEALEAEIIEDEFLAPVLKNSKILTTLINTDDLIAVYGELSSIDINTSVEEIALSFLEIEKGFKAFRKARTSIERARKEIGEPAYQFHKSVIAIAKEVQLKINPFEEKLKALVAKVENEEKRKQIEAEELEEARITNIKRIINGYRDSPLQCVSKSADVIKDMIRLIEAPTRDVLEEFYDEALLIYDNSLLQMSQMYNNQHLVENAKIIQERADAEAKAIQDEENRKLQQEKDLLAEQKLEFQKQQDDFNCKQREAQEAIDLQKAEIEASELQKKQDAEKIVSDEINSAKIIEFENEIKNFKYPTLFVVVGIEKHGENLEAIAYESKLTSVKDAEDFRNRVNLSSKIFKLVEIVK